MLEKYIKMGLAAAACTLLGVSASEAAVTLTFSQVGANVHATWSGSYTVPVGGPGTFGGGQVAFSQLSASTARGFAGPTGASFLFDSGGTAASGITLPSLFVNGYTGTTFGYSGSQFFAPLGTVGVFSPVGTMVFGGTLAGLGLANFNNVLAYTGGNNSGELSKIYLTTAGISAIPEPGSVLGPAGLLASGLLFRRRKLGTERGC